MEGIIESARAQKSPTEVGLGLTHAGGEKQRAQRRAAPKRARILSGDRPTYSSDEGLS